MTADTLPSGKTSTFPMPDFDSFYRAINGRDAFPWQLRLARQVADTEKWPAEVGVPTGLGKTACLDIAVWWLASQADRDPSNRSAPTRIWWVVNRRLLVDSTFDHADSIRAKLQASLDAEVTTEAERTVAAVADRLRLLARRPGVPLEKTRPLEVIRLRGNVRARRPTDPAQPAVVLSTLPMYGSRLLFRGYGSTRRMRPIDAAMAGIDSLVLLDEAHLAPHLVSLCNALEECAPKERNVLQGARSRPRIVALTATGRVEDESRFELDERDYAHPIVRQRLDAPKPTRLRDCGARNVGKTLATAIKDLLADAPEPATGLVFANTPKTARQAFGQLKKLMSNNAEVLLLTGRIREREAGRIRGRILHREDGMAAGGGPGRRRERHLIAVATQTLEVGADIDAEYLVTENCGVRALTQRLGRLNRLGQHPHAAGVYVHAPPASRRTNEWPVYGAEPNVVKDRLEQAQSRNSDGTIDLGPRHIRSVLGTPCDRPGDAPEVLVGLLWEWVKTTTPPNGEAPVEPYFSGIARPDRLVSLIWRVHIPDADGIQRLWPRARNSESVSVPINEFRDVLRDVLKEDTVSRIRADRITLERARVTDVRPGDTIVLHTDRGLLDDYGWEPTSQLPIVDMSLLGRGLPLAREALHRLCRISISDRLIRKALGVSRDDENVDPAEQSRAVDQILAAVREADTPAGWAQEEWKGFVGSLTTKTIQPKSEVARLRANRDAEEDEEKSDEFDELSLVAQSTTLDWTLARHGTDVGTRARAIAERLGLPSDLCQAVERAGQLHDVGKTDARFQRWLDPEGKHEGVTLAKSNMPRHRWERVRIEAGWPRGGRHEVLSARLVEQRLDRDRGRVGELLDDLLLHLIVSHHGQGRPLVRPPADDDRTHAGVSGNVEGRAVHASANLSTIDWTQPARFRRLNDEFGPWGLALLEAVLCRADHAVSASSQQTLPERRT